MSIFFRKKANAIVEYAIILAFFAFSLGLTILWMTPGPMKRYFEKSIDNSTTSSGGKITMKVMGEST
jgi:hypothetical protein